MMMHPDDWRKVNAIVFATLIAGLVAVAAKAAFVFWRS